MSSHSLDPFCDPFSKLWFDALGDPHCLWLFSIFLRPVGRWLKWIYVGIVNSPGEVALMKDSRNSWMFHDVHLELTISYHVSPDFWPYSKKLISPRNLRIIIESLPWTINKVYGTYSTSSFNVENRWYNYQNKTNSKKNNSKTCKAGDITYHLYIYILNIKDRNISHHLTFPDGPCTVCASFMASRRVRR